MSQPINIFRTKLSLNPTAYNVTLEARTLIYYNHKENFATFDQTLNYF